jgi:hypothetical protein
MQASAVGLQPSVSVLAPGDSQVSALVGRLVALGRVVPRR